MRTTSLSTLFSSSALLLVVGLGGCGKKAPAPPATSAPATQAPATSAPPTSGPATTAAAPDAGAVQDAGNATVAEAPDAGAAVTSDDLIVWTGGTSGRQTVWLHGDDVVATRPEAVTVFDGKVWALGERWRVIKQYPCATGGSDDLATGDHTKAPTPIVAATLVAKELGGAGEIVVANAVTDADSEWDGDIEGTVALEGAIGAKLFVAGGEGFYGCGAAHPEASGFAEVFDLATKAAAPIEASPELQKKVADALLAERKASGTDCSGDDAPAIEPGAPSTLVLGYAEGHAQVAWQADGPEEAHYRQACEVSAKLPVTGDASLGFGPFDARLEKVLAGAKGQGVFGFATVPADKREALLELFKKEAPSFQPAPKVEAPPAEGEVGVASLIEQGRKATRAKDYAGAIAAFDQALTKDAKSPEAYSGRGYAKLLAGDMAQAKADLEKALTLETKNAGFQSAVWFNLGQIAEKAKDLTAAKAAYEKAAALKPSKAVQKALDRVSK